MQEVTSLNIQDNSGRIQKRWIKTTSPQWNKLNTNKRFLKGLPVYGVWHEIADCDAGLPPFDTGWIGYLSTKYIYNSLCYAKVKDGL